MATKAEQVYEEINELVASGGAASKAEAFKQKAEEYGQPVDSIRGAYYTHKRKLEGGTTNGGSSGRRPRKRETTPADAIESAVATLRRSIDNIDAEVEFAEERATEAAAEHQALADSAQARKAEIEKKIKALTT